MKATLRAAALGSILVLVVGVAFVGALDPSQYSEDFSTADFRDPVASNAVWDTGAGEIRLAPFSGMASIGGYDTPGSTYTVTIDGDHAFVSDFNTEMLVLDISDPTSPSLAGIGTVAGAVVDVAVAGDRAYVADYYGELVVFDIADPTAPVFVAVLSMPGNPYSVVIDGDVAYIACMVGGIVSVDISDPALPSVMDSFPTPGTAYDVALEGDLAYVADYSGGVAVIDVSDPSNLALSGVAGTTGVARGLAVAGDRVFVAADSGGLVVFDVSDPANPVQTATYPTTGSAMGVAVSGDFAYLACYTDGLMSFDVSDPDAPVPLDQVFLSGVRSVALAGEHAFLGRTGWGVGVVDICDSTYPLENGECPLQGMADCVALSGDYAFVSGNSSGLNVVDVSDPTAPAIVGQDQGTASPLAAVVAGDRLFLADAAYGLLVYDITAPANPQQIGACNPPGWPRSLALAGDYAFMGQYDSIETILISDPSLPVAMASIPATTVMDLCLHGDLLLAACDDAGLVLYDVGDPLAVTPLSDVQTYGDALGVDVSGDHAFVAMEAGDLDVFDISDPATGPVLVGEVSLAGGAVDVVVSGDVAHVAVPGRGVATLDVSDPAVPVLTGYNEAGISAKRIAVAGDHVYAAAYWDGFWTFSAFQRSYDHGNGRAQSLTLDGNGLPIVAARLSATETGRVRWRLSTVGGTSWQDFVPDDAWHQLDEHGSNLVWQARLQLPTPLDPASCSGLDIDWLYDCPVVEAVEDIPGDQGLQVRLRWSRSGYDFVGLPQQVVEYAVYRRVDGAAARILPPEGLAQASRDHALAMAAAGWDYVTTVPVRAQDEYAVVVPTLADSTAEAGAVWSTFVVSAMTAVPGVFFDSPPDSGYSVDNLAPNVPEGLMVAYAAGGNELAWLESDAEDFRFFKVYRGATPDFAVDPEDPAHLTTTPSWIDPAGGFDVYYKVSAVDFAGNESDAAAPGGLTDAGTPAARFALHGAAPNPFNPRTAIRFEIPEAAAVTLRIYDLSGRLVRTLLDTSPCTGGRHEVAWDGRDGSGRMLGAGGYVARLESGGRTDVTRMMLVR